MLKKGAIQQVKSEPGQIYFDIHLDKTQKIYSFSMGKKLVKEN